MTRHLNRWTVASTLAVTLGFIGGCNRAKRICPENSKPTGAQTDGGVWCRTDTPQTYWVEIHPNTEIARQRCPFEEGRPSGPYEALHVNGALWLKGAYSFGKKSGVWEQWNKEGRRVAQGQYRNGDLVAGAPVGMTATCETITAKAP